MDIKLSDALVVAGFSAGIGFLTQLLVKWLDQRKQAHTYQVAILAEVSALYDLAVQRKYKEVFEERIEYLNQAPMENPIIIVPFQDELTPVYSNNLEKIGYLNPNIVNDVVRFYAHIFALKQDLIPGGALTNSATANLESYENSYEILKEILRLGEKLDNIKNHK
ncbi:MULTISPECIES: hypothetical protein [Acinetobacter]|uniref:hypothetical protein n=1 Tax=Acinetobacter TaxID=469 RepID=UPI0025BF0C85|nr:hypothetical protein [Acinetobacter sp. UBA3025]